MSSSQTIYTTLIGMMVGLLGGIFGKGGSALATPLLSLIGLPGFVAVASPLPATVPSTLVASFAYWRADFMDWEVVRWGILAGVPSTIAGAWLSDVLGSRVLLALTGVLVFGFGVSFLFGKKDHVATRGNGSDPLLTMRQRSIIVVIGIVVGVISGLLANAGGFLLAPLYARVLKLPIKTAFACSLLVSSVLAVPGTIVHWQLGHISWTVSAFLALGTIPLSYLGARLAILSGSGLLQRLYGIALTIFGIFFLFHI